MNLIVPQNTLGPDAFVMRQLLVGAEEGATDADAKLLVPLLLKQLFCFFDVSHRLF